VTRPLAPREKKRHGHGHKRRKARYKLHWKQLLYQQAAAYAVVLFLWVLPLPNPVKVLAVTFHEISHALMAVATGGSVIGFAIAPNGAGVTFGIGGNLFAILIAGYLGSCLWGALLYYLSVEWRAATCLLALEVFVLVTAVFGWLNDFTAWFGLGSVALMTALFWTPTWAQTFFIRLVGSACCCYAPLEVAGELFRMGSAPRVMGHHTASDVDQLASMAGIPAALIIVVLLAAQFALVYGLVRWTCKHGAKGEVRAEWREEQAIRARIKELRQITRVGNSFRR
jgi:hypothetical protein